MVQSGQVFLGTLTTSSEGTWRADWNDSGIIEGGYEFAVKDKTTRQVTLLHFTVDVTNS